MSHSSTDESEASARLARGEQLLLDSETQLLTALGGLAFHWNGLQEALCSLFCALVQSSNSEIGESIWHNIKSDRGQRDILMALLPVARISGLRLPNEFQRDIKDVLAKIIRFEDTRNNAIHAPLGVDIDDYGFVFKPDMATNNPRAKKLDGKDVIAEFNYVAHCANLYRAYIKVAAQKILDRNAPFPQKPQAPPISQFLTRRTEHHQSERK